MNPWLAEVLKILVLGSAVSALGFWAAGENTNSMLAGVFLIVFSILLGIVMLV